MKKTILQSAIIGAKAGFSLAVLNSILALIALELSWPIPEPTKVVIFTPDFLKKDFLSFLFTTLQWAIPSALIGDVTAGIFGFILLKYKPSKKRYISICNTISITLACIYLVGWIWFMYMSTSRYLASRLFGLIFESPLVGLVLVIFPPLFFVFDGYFVSLKLFARFSKLYDANSITS